MSESDSTVLVAAVKLLYWSMVKKNCFKPTLMTFHQRKCKNTDRAMMQQTDRSCKNKWFMKHAHDSMWAHWTSAAATSPTDMYHGFWQHFVLSQPLNHTHTHICFSQEIIHLNHTCLYSDNFHLTQNYTHYLLWNSFKVLTTYIIWGQQYSADAHFLHTA